MEFLTESEWRDKHGESMVEPKYSSRGVRGVDVKRCQAIAAGKNKKIQARNRALYSAYIDAWLLLGNKFADLEGVSLDGEDRFEAAIRWLVADKGQQAAEAVIEASGRYVRTEDGKWKRNDNHIDHTRAPH